MADITMCMNMECIDREKCYRVHAIPNEYRQAYCNFPREKTNCEWLIPLYGKDNPLVNDNKYEEEHVLSKNTHRIE